jgi:uncharacterized protein YndB with AHSA1/START domain
MIPPNSYGSTTLVLRRIFTAPRQKVFRAWIEPEALETWFKPVGMHMTVSKLEAYVGGAFHFHLENGNSIFGTYLHIAPPEKLVFTWAGEATMGHNTIVTLDFVDLGAKTEVVLTHERLDAPALHKMFGAGWSSSLDALAASFSD